MNHWPLRLKLALWSVLVVALAMLAFTTGAAWHSYQEDVELIDHVLDDSLRDIFAELKHHGNQWEGKNAEAMQARLPRAWSRHQVEIYHAGKTFFRSEKLHGYPLDLDAMEPGFHSI